MNISVQKTCTQCKYFTPIVNASTGICTNNKGYKEATAQGLPKPKKGAGYAEYFNPFCKDFIAK